MTLTADVTLDCGCVVTVDHWRGTRIVRCGGHGIRHAVTADSDITTYNSRRIDPEPASQPSSTSESERT